MKRPAVLLALALLLLPSALIFYCIVLLGYPIFPTVSGQTWQLSIDARVKADKGEISVVLGLPYEHAGRMVVEERMTSGMLSFHLLREGPNRVGIWLGAVGPGEEAIAYRATILVRPRRPPQNATATTWNLPAGCRKWRTGPGRTPGEEVEPACTTGPSSRRRLGCSGRLGRPCTGRTGPAGMVSRAGEAWPSWNAPFAVPGRRSSRANC